MSTYPPFFFNIHFSKFFLDNQLFSWLCRFIYKLGYNFFIYRTWYTSNFETTYKKPPFIMVAICFWCSFSIKLSWLQRRSNKINTMLYGIYYLQNFKAINLKKLQIIQNIKNLIFQVIFICSYNFDQANHSFLHPFLLLGEAGLRKNAAWGNEYGKWLTLGKERFAWGTKGIGKLYKLTIKWTSSKTVVKGFPYTLRVTSTYYFKSIASRKKKIFLKT